MTGSARFWIATTAFQVVFGLAVFGITRQYYMDDSDAISAEPTVTGEPSIIWADPSTEPSPAQLGSSTSGQPIAEDPAQISRQASEAFANQQYNQAAQLYEQLLALNPDDVNTYNNLGITLHYLGRSAEALRRLDEGVALDPTYQRIWLTLGFVKSQLDDIEQARAALTTAAQMGTANEVGQSALRMLETLPVTTRPLLDSH